jgi:hypothetical protein
VRRRESHPATIDRREPGGRLREFNGVTRCYGPLGSCVLGAPCYLVSVLGRDCHAVIAAKELSGNIHCQEDCSLRKMVRCNEPIHSFEMQVRMLAVS